tara:strand:- start:71 stop:298 length:228 start_codon:yes stop_codon:yes gene_type:complete
MAKKSLDFETALKELEQVVASLESGELALQDSLKAFEKGVELTRYCQTSLQAAELKVQELTNTSESVDTPANEAK